VLLEATGLLVDDELDGLVLLLDDAVGLLLELLPVPDEAVLPGLRQGLVLPVLDEPMLLVSEPVADPVPEPVSAPVVEPLEVACACTANEAIASAAPAATTASVWVLVMSEVLWLRRHSRRPIPAFGRIPHGCGNGCARQHRRGQARAGSARR